MRAGFEEARPGLRRWIGAAAVLLLAHAGAGELPAIRYEVPAILDFSVRDEGRDGFDEVLEGECCIRATIFTAFRIRGVAEFDLSLLPPGLEITSATLRLVLVSGTGDNPADFYAFASDGAAGVDDAERTELLLADNLQIVTSVVDFSQPSLTTLIQSLYTQQGGGHFGLMFKLTREHELSFRDLEFAANDGNPNRPRLIIEAELAPPPEVSPPGAAIPFTLARGAAGMLDLAWEPAAGATSYRIVAGDLSSLLPENGVTAVNAAPMQCGVAGTTATIPEPAGTVFLLVAGENAGGVGPLGDGASGPRAASPACP